ncbi:MAG TPA: 4Fe-4S dicluster domain-containing protein [Dehalococcoidales bacterium]|nr:4Fe-4S dicluster domain-containing protein [Dehalococcoidales bacterium]
MQKTLRKIVKIDEELCNGCGACVISCAEGALKIIDGKARLVSEKYCDGLGNCVSCPQGAITIEEREAEDFNEAAVEEHLNAEKEEVKLSCGCASANVARFTRETAVSAPEKSSPARIQSRLAHWPVQLTLVPPSAPFLKGADVVLAAHCVPFAYAGFHRDFLGDNVALLTACPKLDDFEAHQDKLNQILKQSGIKSLTVLHMEVPCCSGIVHMAKQAILASGNVVPFRDITISIRGDIMNG